MFYNWKKNEVIRKININKEYINSQLLFINKYTFLGYSPTLKNIFMISLIDNKYFVFERTIITKYIIHLYNNYFILLNGSNYFILNILEINNNNKNNNNNREQRLFSQEEENNFFNKRGLFD